MSGHSPLPWETFGMGDIMSKGLDGHYWLVKTNYEHAPPSHIAEREANAAFIVKAVNNHEALVKALEEILSAEKEFREGLPPDWDGDPLHDACVAAEVILLSLHSRPVGPPLTSPEGK